MKKLRTILAGLLSVLVLCSTAYADSGFNAGLAVDRSTAGQILVTVQDSTVLHDKVPTLSIPCDFTYAEVTFGGNVIPNTIAGGNISFKVSAGGTYVITEVDEPVVLYTVIYTDGVGGAAFADQVYENLEEGTATPEFNGTPSRNRYTFAGWTPEVPDTVISNITITAQWTPFIPFVPSTPSTDTNTNKEESTTTTVTDKETGTVTEITKNPDGSTQVTETTTKITEKADGATETVSKATTTATDAEGNVTTSVTTTTVTTLADGTTGTAVADENGKMEAEVVISKEVAASEEPVALPIPAVTATTDRENASTVTVTTNSEKETAVVIPVAEGTGAGAVAIIVNADGTETVVTESVVTENGLEVEVPDGATIKVVDNSTHFADVDATDWEKDAVDFTSARGIMNGTSTGENAIFDPDAPTTRAMVWTMLARLSGVNTTPAEGEDWWTVGQKWAMENGISDGTMHDGEITREQLATMLYRFAGSPETDHDITHFDDHHETSDWALDAKQWAVENGVINGAGQADGSVTLEPKGNALRSHVAQMFMNFMTKIND